MIIVGDASVFIALQRIDVLPLLPLLFGEVHVPEAVWPEVFVPRPAITAPAVPAWIVRHPAPAHGQPEACWPRSTPENPQPSSSLKRSAQTCC